MTESHSDVVFDGVSEFAAQDGSFSLTLGTPSHLQTKDLELDMTCAELTGGASN